MYRRNSAIYSAKSITSPHSNGHIGSDILQNHTSGLSPSVRSATYPVNTGKLSIDTDNINPDDLFAKYTVSEVKVVQQRLRHDADAKQEELRLMVGERYRDLLQASSSIISIAASSRRVLDALDECRGAIIAQKEPPLPSRAPAANGLNDEHLHILQTLSAHMKVLLDAPEHLWRLIERKKYLSAAWLFLFTRVVHRALVRSDDQDDDSWSKVGVDVLTEFPLVQRQWDEVTTFRSQIIHKATLSLRDIGTSPYDICAILVTLHLLDSRPLGETLTSLLGQRSKALQALVSLRVDHLKPSPMNSRITGGDSPTQTDTPNLRRNHAREVSQASHQVLSIIFDTVSIARRVFQSNKNGSSLINLVLEFVQAGKPVDDDILALPAELKLSTHILLTQSSSSAHFLLLPANLQSYRPYIDLNSSSVAYSQVQLSEALWNWLQKASQLWKGAADSWLLSLISVAEIWTLRSLVKQWIENSGLEPTGKHDLANIFDDLCRSRILAVWKSILVNAEDEFKKQLHSFVSKFSESPIGTLFEPTTPPLSSQNSKPVVKSPFQQYRSSLKRQLLGRTAQLEAVLATLEQCARNIQKDFSISTSDTTLNGKAFGQNLADAYQPMAESLSTNVATTLEVATDEIINISEASVNSIIALAMVSDELTSSSIFVTHIGCKRSAIENFRSRIDNIQDCLVDRWREQTIERILRDRSPRRFKHVVTPKGAIAGPSPRLLQSLISLSAALQQLGVVKHHVRRESVIQTALRLLIKKYITDGWDEPPEQFVYNLVFLKAVAETYGREWDDISVLILEKIETNTLSGIDIHKFQHSASEYLTRTQTLFSVLLPYPVRIDAPPSSSDKFPNFLLFGTPSSSQEYHPAIELVKPSSRFGLLLVSSGVSL